MMRCHRPARLPQGDILTQPPSRRGFTLLELAVVLAIIVILSGIAIPNISDLLASTRLQNAAAQMVQDLKEVHDDAVLYQQDLRVYFCIGGDGSTYRFERSLKNPLAAQESDQHYGVADVASSAFVWRSLPYGVRVTSISLSSTDSTTGGWLTGTDVSANGTYMMYFCAGSGVRFRGQPSASGTITLVDQSGKRHFYVFVGAAGSVHSSGNPSG